MMPGAPAAAIEQDGLCVAVIFTAQVGLTMIATLGGGAAGGDVEVRDDERVELACAR